MLLFMVEYGNAHVITWADGREDAKRKAQVWLRLNPDLYTVTPLTQEGDTIHLSVSLNA